jgi:CubicO group peptidase (beta-lactamase class C family)
MRILIIIIIIALTVSVLCSCKPKNNKSAEVTNTTENKGYFPTTEWRTSTPEKHGMNADSIKKGFDLYGSKGSIVVVKDGFIVAENYPSLYDSTSMHHIFSCTKSVTSILFGIAIKKGLVNSEQDKLIEYFNDLEILNLDSLKKSIRLEDILTMTSGLEWKGGIDGADIHEMIRHQYDWTKFVIDKPMANIPGIKFNYNSGGTQLLSSIIQRESKITTEEFAKMNLFKPLGIDSTTWNIWPSKNGETSGAWGLSMTVRDMAKLGYLYLSNGKWNNEQILSEEWVEKSTRDHLLKSKGKNGYGYQWWILDGYPKKTYSAIGMYGGVYAHIIVVPHYDLVVAIAGPITYKMRNEIMKKYIIGAIEK